MKGFTFVVQTEIEVVALESGASQDINGQVTCIGMNDTLTIACYILVYILPHVVRIESLLATSHNTQEASASLTTAIESFSGLQLLSQCHCLSISKQA